MSWRKWLSYLIPVSKEAKSDFSGTLEVTWRKGKKVLDSTNANYSYGALQDVLRFGLNHASWSKSGNVLVLGLGAGSVVEVLVDECGHTGPIFGVEWDEQIIELAYSDFQLGRFTNLEVFCEDAFHFLEDHHAEYDLIVVDLFLDNATHPQVLSDEFLSSLETLAGPNSAILVNAGMKSEDTTSVFTDFQFTPVPIPDHPNSIWVRQVR